MKIENYIDQAGKPGVSGLFFACGSFGVVDGDAKYECTGDDTKRVYTYENGAVRLKSEFTVYENGIVIRRDTFENLSDDEIVLNKLVNRFRMDADAYEVYTQFSGWQHESDGAWQPLITQVSAASEGIRTCDGASPIMALRNLHSKKTTVFHLIPNAMWEMNVRKYADSCKELVVVETGFEDAGMHMNVAPGECIELPTVIFFNTENSDDFDMYKLHNIYNEMYPRRKMPVLFNSWLCCFDTLNEEGLYNQADTAAELGVEAFMIDAGWFGEKNWYTSVGDWVENPKVLPNGGLTALSEYVRSKGMIFGLWFEPERAYRTSTAAKTHPEYYIGGYSGGQFLDFANDDANDYMFDVLCSQIDKYSIGWVKFDFNASIPYDPSGNSFYRYMQGQRRFIGRLRERYPDLYITNCAGGGYRMELGHGMLYDSYWPSDNESMIDEMTIIKNSLKRLPSALIERWAVLNWSGEFPWYTHNEKRNLMLTCRGATWENVEIVSDNFMKAYMTGGPIGFSCDIASFSTEYKEMFKAHIEKFKQDREFYLKASARLLVDSKDIIAIEYADAELSRCLVQVFTKQTHALELTVYPVLDCGAMYRLGEEEISGESVVADGIRLSSLKDNDCVTLEFIKI